MPLPPTFEARLVRARVLAPQVRELVFARVDGAPVDLEAGQWVTLMLPLPGLPTELRRSYSIASPPRGTPEIEIAVTHVEGGAGSRYLHDLEIGQTLKVQGPQGFFVRGKGTGKAALFVGTGTGVTPLRSLLLDALARDDRNPLVLLFGVRTRQDLLYAGELAELAAAHPNVRIEPTLSRSDDDWTGRRGYVQHHVAELWNELRGETETPADVHVYICGLNRMVASVRELLRGELGATREQVHSERYD